MDDLLRQFESLLTQTGSGMAGSVELLLMQMEPEQARRLRLCAIPHQFDAATLRVLDPELSESGARETFQEFAGLSVVLKRGEAELALHDEARSYLFTQWLAPENLDAFRQASGRLVAHFERLAQVATGVDREAYERNRMFHRVGADPEYGFEDFSHLLKEKRHEFRLSECGALLTLAREYEPVLTPRQRFRLAYYEGRLALDQAKWTQAQHLFEKTLQQDGVPRDVRIKVLKRLGMAYAEQRKYDRAEAVLREALSLAQSVDGLPEMVDDIMHDLACVYRDTQRAGEAEQLFRQAIRLAEAQNDQNTLAVVHNSMGTLYRELGRSEEAIRLYQRSLEFLVSEEDHFRRAQVYNNLGMAHADLNDWAQSAEMLNQSLDVKRQAGDTRGTAIALNNLARVYHNLSDRTRAVDVTRKAADLFLEVKDLYNASQALRNLARLHELDGRPDDAATARAEADAIAQRMNVPKRDDTGRLDLIGIAEPVFASAPARRFSRIGCLVAVVIFILLIAIALVAG